MSAPGGGGASVEIGAGALDTGTADANNAGGCDTGAGAGGPAGRATGAAAAGTPGKGDGPVFAAGPGGPREAFIGPTALAGLITAGAAGMPPCKRTCKKVRIRHGDTHECHANRVNTRALSKHTYLNRPGA